MADKKYLKKNGQIYTSLLKNINLYIQDGEQTLSRVNTQKILPSYISQTVENQI